MIFDHVYAGSTNYHLLCIILHRLAHPEGRAVLFVLNLNHTPEAMGRLATSLTRSGVFDSVQTYDEQGIWSRMAIDTLGTSVPETAAARMKHGHLTRLKSDVIAHFKAAVGEVGHDRTLWYVASDQSSFGMALTFSGVAYAQFEDHSGGLEHPELFLNTLAQQNAFKHKVYELMAGMRRECIRLHVVDVLTGPAPVDAAPVEQLRVRDTLDAMPEETLAAVMAAFGYDAHRAALPDGYVALLITQPFARWRFLDWMRQKELYYTLVDYFAPHASLVVKPHPRDDLTPYSEWFPAAQIAPASVPMELVMTSMRPSMALTVGSTAIFPLRASGTSTVFLGQGFERVHQHMHRIFALTTVLRSLGVQSVVSAEGFPEDALQSFFVAADAVARDDPEDAAALACWAVPPAGQAFDDFHVVASMVPITLPDPGVTEFAVAVRRQQPGRPYATQSFVYFYSRDANMFDDVKGMTLERNLPNLQEVLTIVFPADGDAVFLQARVASLEARVIELTEQLRDASASNAESRDE